ncbi:MAG: NAD(P)H-hydrate epimerase [Candidatus Omnitrophica bacterium]|nr:NAD(P)H-hydrate epimerase [Candidatus Omnitrophota bacterium]
MSVARMQQIDAAAIDTLGIPRLFLMEHAGLAVARAVQTLAAPRTQPILICAGTGFNGGDGLAAARHLHAWGYPLQVLLTAPVSRLTGEPALYAAILQRLGLTLTDASNPAARPSVDAAFRGCAAVVDALLGIGAQGPVREPAASLIRLMNASQKPVVAVDVPSGLDADSGAVQGVAVRATLTVTFGLAKRGCVRGEGPAHTGALIVDPITFPSHLLQGAEG